MTDKVNYSIVHSQAGNISVQSKVTSFNLDHVTEKDIVTFYKSFSQYAALDTGLLPVDGTGLLALRTAGEYTQFAYQHKPGLYHVNWAQSEGSRAAAYYVAQPYRVIICDMHNGNLLGARMFYSPYPITHPSQPLYHVNLPNINCKGYRGNGVGWICLYQNEDWSALPLNERIVRFIERCSGVETYNDANMSETDGTRFYKERGKPSYTWDPLEWQDKSYNEGFGWTLDETLWIPILVKSMDSQGEHYDGGVPLTFADALVGDYQAYYYDKSPTKPINAIIRPDKDFPESSVLSLFVASYTEAQAKPNTMLDNTFSSSEKVKKNIGSSVYTGSSLDNAPESHVQNSSDDSDSSYMCDCCEDFYEEDPYSTDHYGNSICESCHENHYIYIESSGSYFHNEDDGLVYVEAFGDYLHSDFDTILSCGMCSDVYGASGANKVISGINNFFDGVYVCNDCVADYAEENEYETHNCHSCNAIVLSPSNFEEADAIDLSYFKNNPKLIINEPYIDFENNGAIVNKLATIYLCQKCVSDKVVCPCGKVKDKNADDFNPCTTTQVKFKSENDDQILDYYVSKACVTCVSPAKIDENENVISNFIPENDLFFKLYHSALHASGGLSDKHKGIVHSDDLF